MKERMSDVKSKGVLLYDGACPFCIAQWIATGFAFGLVLAPRATRLVAGTLSAVTSSDWLQFAHSALQKTEE